MEGKSPYKNVLSQVHPEKCADGYSDVIRVYIRRQDIRNIMLAVRRISTYDDISYQVATYLGQLKMYYVRRPISTQMCFRCMLSGKMFEVGPDTCSTIS